jgi:hypothetical protein
MLEQRLQKSFDHTYTIMRELEGKSLKSINTLYKYKLVVDENDKDEKKKVKTEYD